MRRARERGLAVTSLGLKGRVSEGDHIAVDLRDAEALRRSLSGRRFDHVVNCGGYVDHRAFRDGGRAMLDAHFTGLLNLVECLDRDALRSFVNIGSSDEYGAAPAPQAESLREAPISPYSMAKVAATQFLQMLHRTEGFPAATLRFFLTYGPGQDQKRFIPQIIAGCLGGSAFPTTHGEQLRDFCYIDDTVEAILAALRTPRCHGEVINVASGRPISIRSIIETICDSLGSGAPQFGALSYRSGENMALYADVTKARDLLGWSAETNLVTGLARTIESFRQAA